MKSNAVGETTAGRTELYVLKWVFFFPYSTVINVYITRGYLWRLSRVISVTYWIEEVFVQNQCM